MCSCYVILISREKDQNSYKSLLLKYKYYQFQSKVQNVRITDYGTCLTKVKDNTPENGY